MKKFEAIKNLSQQVIACDALLSKKHMPNDFLDYEKKMKETYLIAIDAIKKLMEEENNG